MLVPTQTLLVQAQTGRYAIGAFNVYNLEGVRAVLEAAQQANSPVMLQLHPQALKYGGVPLIALCLQAANRASVPVSVHLDHSSSEQDIRQALDAGVISIMADGSHLAYDENIAFTVRMAALAHEKNGFVEAELGRLSGTEDGLTILELEARMTDSVKAADFLQRSGVDALAVCIGNVHGHYPGEPKLDFPRLAEIRRRVSVPLVLHGASGLPEEMIRKSIELGICKFNVNTEVRDAFVSSLGKSLFDNPKTDLLALMQAAIQAMGQVVLQKITLFGSQGKAGDF
ncbi:MAG: class II fructose-bisphosphate aldolase family protein [Chloroflexi bacterium]|nr:class II fructose-bisphosphate aldolase family protein [Chloroflexota bacterium]